ncbi:MAG: hypothetical protein AAGB32_01485 [Pseudomonadota bacterium]
MIKHILPLLVAVFYLGGCAQTFEGLKTDLNKLGNAVSETTSNMTGRSLPANTIVQGDLCPPVSIPEQMGSLTEFNDPQNTGDDQIVSRFVLKQSNAVCETDGGAVAMQIDLTFYGMLGPKAKRLEGDKPFFSYPYFIAVKDINGNELAREVFAANVGYANDQKNVQVVETIRQRLPLEDGTAPYTVEVGLSLTEDQLVYNATPEQES